VLHQLKRLAKHSAIYGLGGLVARVLAVLLLPLYTRYLTPSDYGVIETLVALVAVLTVLLRLGTQSAFFRFYFDSPDPAHRLTVVRTAFWFTITSSTIGLIAGVATAGPIADALFGDPGRSELVIAAFVGLWAQMNYGQLTSLFRVEERSVAFVLATIANVLITIGATILLVVVFEQGPLGVLVGNFTGTLAVYLALVAYRREQLGLQFDRELFRRMEHFGLPLVPSALALWALNWANRFFLIKLAGAAPTGLYSIGFRVSSVVIFLLTAFRTAWPAFAFSIEDEREAKRAYSFVLTYLLLLCSWLAVALGVLAPWLVRLLATPEFYDGADVVAPLAFGAVAFAGYTVVVVGVSRVRQTQFNWMITGLAAAVDIGLNLALIPPYDEMGAALATLGAYLVLFVGMTWRAQRLYPVPYQWRRVVTVTGAAAGLTAIGWSLDLSLPAAIVLVAAYPLVLAALGFYLPAERRRALALLRREQPGDVHDRDAREEPAEHVR
jgi:O-antigen/teichoic acid export membrane protein